MVEMRSTSRKWKLLAMRQLCNREHREVWADLHHYPSGQWHICLTSLGLGYFSAMMILQQLLTWDDYVLSISGRSSKMAKQGAARKHLTARSWKFIRNADVNISSSEPTACATVEKLNPLDGDRCAEVDGNPGCRFALCVAKICTCTISRSLIRALCVSINALGSSKVVVILECRR